MDISIKSYETKINSVSTIDEITMLKNKINTDIVKYFNNITELKNLVDILDEKINSICNHIWLRDYRYYGEHSQFICENCGTVK